MKKDFQPNSNTLKNTFCVFSERDMSEISILSPNFISPSGSTYFYTEIGLYRLSNHWGRLANSKWRLVRDETVLSGKYKLGFAKWDEFYIDNGIDFIYYIEYDPNVGEVLYQHKKNPKYDEKAILRNASDTMKRIKTARNIINLINWAKYFENWDIEDLRNIIINELIYTNKSIETIKMELHGQK